MPRTTPMRQFAVAIRPRVAPRSVQRVQWLAPALTQTRSYADNSKLHPNPTVTPNTDPQPQTSSSTASPAAGSPSSAAQSKQDANAPNTQQLPHVSEEAAALSKSQGTQGPELEQGTPVIEVVKDDKEAQKNLPKVMKDALKQQGQKRGFATSARWMRPDLQTQDHDGGFVNPQAALSSRMSLLPRQNADGAVPPREQQLWPGQYHEITEEEAMMIARGEVLDPVAARAAAQLEAQNAQGLKFAEPSTPLSRQRHLRRRYDSIVEQVTNMMMRHGKKSVAQKHMAEALTHLRTSPAPTSTPSKRLLPLPPTAPTPAHLPLHPVLYMTHAIDSIAPLMRLRSQRGLAGGGMAVQIPVPLSLRQRRRTAIVWILEACDKRKGGTSGFAKRFAEEIVSIVEGRSAVWQKREGQHRMGVSGRSNLNLVKGGRR